MEVYFRTRGDFRVVHEPFADSYWKGRDANEVLQKLKLSVSTSDAPVFIKDIAHHLPKSIREDKDFICSFTHVILVRAPLAAFHSHIRVNPQVKPHEFGYQALFETLRQIQRLTGKTPYILIADDLTSNPSETIELLCKSLDLEHFAEALCWEAKEEKDWRAAQKWQARAALSKGFEQTSDCSLPPLPSDYKEIFELHRRYYLEILAQL